MRQRTPPPQPIIPRRLPRFISGRWFNVPQQYPGSKAPSRRDQGWIVCSCDPRHKLCLLTISVIPLITEFRLPEGASRNRTFRRELFFSCSASKCAREFPCDYRAIGYRPSRMPVTVNGNTLPTFLLCSRRRKLKFTKKRWNPALLIVKISP